MKSLSSIIRKLSETEIVAFRDFLLTHTKGTKNKKLLLFNQLVETQRCKSSSPVRDAGRNSSRQSEYQLKKRLQDELYTFLISQNPLKHSNDLLSLEMECHKKLYCFKVLFDKGISSHAYQMLDEVLTAAMQNSFYSLYLEALSLKNIYFPLKQNSLQKKIPIEIQIRSLEKSVNRNLYIRQYISGSSNTLHDNDQTFRKHLIDELHNYFPHNGATSDRLLDVNHDFSENNFQAAYDKLTALITTEPEMPQDAGTQTIVFIELVKVCICLGDGTRARQWLTRAQAVQSDLKSFLPLLIELQFFTAIRFDTDSYGLQSVLEHAARTHAITENDVLRTKWSFYSLFLPFRNRDFKTVIKLANSDANATFKKRVWLVQAKLLELLSIFELGDIDWLYYKIENLRKVISGTATHTQRPIQIVNLLKRHLYDPLPPDVLEEKLSRIEMRFPWHPLGCEPMNLCKQISLSFKLQPSGPLVAR